MSNQNLNLHLKAIMSVTRRHPHKKTAVLTLGFHCSSVGTCWISCVYNHALGAKQLLDLSFLPLEKEGLDNGNCTKQKTSTSRTAGRSCPPCQFAPSIYFCVIACTFCTHTVIQLLVLASSLHSPQHATGTNPISLARPLPSPGITAEKFHLSEKSPRFNLQLRRSPGHYACPPPPTSTHTVSFWMCWTCKRQSISSQLCAISLSWSPKMNRSCWALCEPVLLFAAQGSIVEPEAKLMHKVRVFIQRKCTTDYFMQCI